MPLTVFISYAHEDASIATALNNSLSEAFGDRVVVLLDKFFMQPGGPLALTVQNNISKADVLMVIATGRERRSHDWGGYELGAFASMHPTPREKPGLAGRIICFCWSKETAPDELAGNLHVHLAIPDDDLKQSVNHYKQRLDIGSDDPVMVVFEDIYKAVQKEPLISHSKVVEAVKALKVALFNVYKARVRETRKLEKQMIVHFHSNDLALPGGTLGPAATYKLSGGAGSLFGLPDNPDKERSWTEVFVPGVKTRRYGDLWIETIQRLLRLRMDGGFEEFDHSLVILDNTGSTLYRPVLTTLSEFNNDDREASLYFIEIKRRVGHGDPVTTQLLEGLDAICRFRFLFLEQTSYFQPLTLNACKTIPEARQFADELMAEIHYLESDLIAAGLNQPANWAGFVDKQKIEDMMNTWRPLRGDIHSHCLKIISSRTDDDVQALTQPLSTTLGETRLKTLPHNSMLLSTLTAKLGEFATRV